MESLTGTLMGSLMVTLKVQQEVELKRRNMEKGDVAQAMTR